MWPFKKVKDKNSFDVGEYLLFEQLREKASKLTGKDHALNWMNKHRNEIASLPLTLKEQLGDIADKAIFEVHCEKAKTFKDGTYAWNWWNRQILPMEYEKEELNKLRGLVEASLGGVWEPPTDYKAPKEKAELPIVSQVVRENSDGTSVTITQYGNLVNDMAGIRFDGQDVVPNVKEILKLQKEKGKPIYGIVGDGNFNQNLYHLDYEKVDQVIEGGDGLSEQFAAEMVFEDGLEGFYMADMAASVFIDGKKVGYFKDYLYSGRVKKAGFEKVRVAVNALIEGRRKVYIDVAGGLTKLVKI